MQCKALCVRAGDLPGLTFSVLRGAPHLALWDPALPSFVCWELCTVNKAFKWKEKNNNRKVRFYIRIHILAIEKMGKKKK